MPARRACLRTVSKSAEGNRKLTVLSLGFISKRTSWAPERSYSDKSARSTNSSAWRSSLKTGIFFFIGSERALGKAEKFRSHCPSRYYIIMYIQMQTHHV